MITELILRLEKIRASFPWEIFLFSPRFPRNTQSQIFLSHFMLRKIPLFYSGLTCLNSAMLLPSEILQKNWKQPGMLFMQNVFRWIILALYRTILHTVRNGI